MDGVWMCDRKKEDILNKGGRPKTPNWPNVQEIPCCSHDRRWGEVIAHEGRVGQGKNSIYEIAWTWSFGGVRSSNHFSQWGNAVRSGVWLEEIGWGGKGKPPISYSRVRPASPEHQKQVGELVDMPASSHWNVTHTWGSTWLTTPICLTLLHQTPLK